MSAGVIGIADALGNTGLTALVGQTVANMLGTNVNPFILIFVFCVLTSVLATLTGSTIGTVYVFAPMAIATCVSLGLDPTAAAAAIVISGWCGPLPAHRRHACHDYGRRQLHDEGILEVHDSAVFHPSFVPDGRCCSDFPDGIMRQSYEK